MTPRQLSHELREGSSPDLVRRRWIIGLNLAGAALGKIVALYQTGIIKRLPDPPLPVFDSDRVDASDYAYKRLQTPDALFMVVNYATTACLAGAGGENRAATNPFLPLAMGAKLVADVGSAATLAREEWAENKALCAYCQAATLCSVAALALAVPEVVRAVQTLRGGSSHSSDGNGGAGSST